MYDPTDTPPDPTRDASLKARLTQTRVPLWVSLALLVLWLATLGWHALALSRAEARLEKDREALTVQAAAEGDALRAQMQARMAEDAIEAQRQFGIALAWAVRGAMIRNNLDQVDQFFTELVKLPHTERVLLAGTDGRVLVATDRRHKGADAASLVGADALRLAQVTVRADRDGSTLLVIPIMGLNARLGTVLVNNRPNAPPAGG
jgi:hypothetical protein